MQVTRTIPILRIFSVEKAREFYVDYLGFAIEWDHRFDENSPAYIQVRRDDLVLHLTEHHGDCCPGSSVFVEMEGVFDLHRELRAKAYRYLRPGVERPPWGGACMTVLDPFGNKILFNDRTAKTGTSEE
ncbi:MAG: VOC family protein [Pseudomonadota bacterium]|jgi:catechol 2,3-dioxygenase-like lactoylglutathione lyase family enzyme|nr:VOC family protein [Pseudomonadota bacterium]